MVSSRRTFLRTTAALAGASALGPWVARAAAKTQPRPFGFGLYGMKAVPILDAIDHVSRIGYRQIELSLLPGYDTEPKVFSAEKRRAAGTRIRERNLDLSSLLISINVSSDGKVQAANLDAIRRAGEVAHDLNAEKTPLVETIVGGKVAEWDANKQLFAQRVRAWAEAADAANVTLCIKAHAGQAVNSAERLLWLYRTVNHPRLALTYDYSHFQFEGIGLEESLREMRPHTRFIHVKDVAVGEKAPRYLLVGESGQIDYVRYFRLLDELNYQGPIIVEVSSQIHSKPGYDGVKTAEKAYAFLSRVVTRRG